MSLVRTIWPAILFGLWGLTSWTATLHGENVSPPAILQWFEASYATMEKRVPDLFLAGYGGTWIPPVGRAGMDGNGDSSVGYDPFDRFRGESIGIDPRPPRRRR